MQVGRLNSSQSSKIQYSIWCRKTDRLQHILCTLSNHLEVPKGTVFAQENVCFVAILVLNVFKLMAALVHHLVQDLDGR